MEKVTVERLKLCNQQKSCIFGNFQRVSEYSTCWAYALYIKYLDVFSAFHIASTQVFYTAATSADF